MATCKECLHFEVCSGFMPTDLDKDVWHYCKIGIPEEIPDIDKRCDSFKDSKSWVEVVRCKDCKHKDGMPGQPNIVCWQMHDDDFCSYGERKDGDGNG